MKKAAFIRDKINEVELKIMEFNQKEEESDEIQYTSEITVEKIRSIISEWAKVPVTKLTKKKMKDIDILIKI